MKKFTLFFSALLFSMMSFAGVVTFDADHDKGNAGTDSNNAAAYTITKSGVTVEVSSGILGTYNNETHYRVYKNQTLTVTSTVGNITSVEFTCTANDDAKYGPGCFTVAAGDYAYSGPVGTWTGSASTITFTATTNQVRATQVVVTVDGEVIPDDKSSIPTKNDLADFYELGQLCVCVYFEEEVCNDVVLAGSYNGWATDPATMAKFSPLEGFDGWYYVAVTDESEAIEGKPVQLKQDGTFSWDYQGGDAAAWTLISGKVDIVDGYSGECDLKNYSTEEPVILTCAYFKRHNSPCVAEIYHDYTIRLIPPFCSDPNGVWFQPAIIGSFNGWSEGVAASDIDMETYEYIFRINDKEGGEFKFRSLEIADWTNQIQLPTEEGGWMDNGNVKLGTETTISLDYSAGKYTKCGEAKDLVTLTYNVTVPEGTYTCYLIGDMNNWSFSNEMTKVDDTHFTITLDKVHDGMTYKYCSGPDWAYEEKTAAGEAVRNRTYSENDVVEAWTAVYVPSGYHHLSVLSNNPTAGIVSGSGTYQYGTYVEISAIANYGYHFSHWSDGVTTNPRLVHITGDATYTAYFEKSTIPTKDDLVGLYEPGQLCVCVYFEEEVCNDVVFIGSYNGWDNSDPASMAKFSPLEGFDGWYYVAVTDESEAIEGKPVQLKQDGSFSWDYQGGDAAAWTLISGKVDILDGYSGECDLKNYSTAEPVILTCAYFKNHNSPCIEEVYHDYTIRLTPPFCADPDGVWFEPAIIGSFNGWSEGVAASDIDVETFEYIFKITDKEGGEFKFRALDDTDWSNQIQLLSESGGWMNNPNVELGKETTISLDYSAGKYTLCDVVNEPEPTDWYQCGDYLYWAYENHRLFFKGSGDMYDFTEWTLPWQSYAHAIQFVTLPEGLTSIGTSAFAGCKYITSVVIPSTVEKIGDSAFENCRMLSSIAFAGQYRLYEIGNWAFYNCHELKELHLPEGVATIGYGAFYGCTYLKELVLPSTMQYIEDNGFALCSKLQCMSVMALTPPIVSARTFEDVDRSIPVYVPAESVSLYQSAPVWEEFYICPKENTSTNIHNSVDSEPTMQKILRDGQLLIIRDGVEYNAMGMEL